MVRPAALLVALLLLTVPATAARAKCCVWRVTSPDGQHVLYLAGSIHALRPSDLPLPAPYDRALAESAEVVFETDISAPPARATRALERAATLPRGTTLRDHVDPRTYAYLRKVLARTRGATNPEKKVEHMRPWVLGWLLEAPGSPAGVRGSLGVDRTIEAGARRGGKRLSGLVSLEEHIDVFGGLSDADGEAYLLLTFIHLNTAGTEFGRTVSAWRRGDTGSLEQRLRDEYRTVPALYDRLLTQRNRRWMPKLEGFLQRGPTRMIVAGAGHMSGPQGLPTLLQNAGYRVEQL